MATEGFVKFEYFSKGIPPYYDSKSFPELLDDESVVVQTPNIEMSYHQYFGLFKRFLMSVGFNEKNIMQGACSLAFNEMNDEKTMREVAEEYDLIMSEQLPDIIADRKKQDEDWIQKTDESWEQRYWALHRKMQEIENQKEFSDYYPHPDQPVYTDEELSAMCDAAEGSKLDHYGVDVSNNDMWEHGVVKASTNDPMKVWNGLVPGSPAAQAAGCVCPVLDNEEMPIDRKWVDVECPLHGRK